MAPRPKDTERNSIPQLEMLRLKAGIRSQKEFAELLGESSNVYSRWLSGRAQGRLTLKQFKLLFRLLQQGTPELTVEDLPDDFSDTVPYGLNLDED